MTTPAPQGYPAPRVPTLELEGVGVTFGTGDRAVAALRDVTLSFAAGEACAVIGRSGSGKSTLISVLGLLRRPTTGQLRVFGGPVPSSSKELAKLRAMRIGMVFQSFHLEPSTTAWENALLPWHFHPQLSRRVAVERCAGIFDRLGIAELRHRKVAKMSGGQRQRVAIARALVGEPAILIADEPTGNLDEETGLSVARDLYALADQGTTVIVVTHDAVIAHMARRVVTLHRGQVSAATGYPEGVGRTP